MRRRRPLYAARAPEICGLLRLSAWVGVTWVCPRPQASSPDEEALVAGAAFAGYRLESRTTNRITVELLRTGEVLEYTVGAGSRISSSVWCSVGAGRLAACGVDVHGW